MRNFRFEYTVMKTLMVILLSGMVLGLLLSIILPDIAIIFNLRLKPLVFVLTPVFCLVFYKNKYKKTGSASIDNNILTLELDGIGQIIPFENIESFQVDSGKGTSLVLNLRNQSSIKVIANRNFCNEGPFFEFCNELEKLLVAYTKISPLPLKRLPSIFEHKWVLPLLTLATVLFFAVLVYIVSLHWDYQEVALIGFAVLGVIWFLWFLAWIKKKRLENWSD